MAGHLINFNVIMMIIIIRAGLLKRRRKGNEGHLNNKSNSLKEL